MSRKPVTLMEPGPADRETAPHGRVRSYAPDRSAVTNDPSLAWSISEAAKRAGVSASTIRTWEREGLIRPHRSPGGTRRFDESQMRRIERIAYLRRVHKLNTAGIKAALEDGSADSAESQEPAGGPSYGEHLRRVRKQQKLTLADVAAATGLSVSFISALELGQVGAGVATIQKLLRFYGTTETAMLNSTASGENGTLLRKSDRTRVRDSFNKVTTEQLVPVHSSLGASLSTVEPGGGSNGAYTHEGDEFVYVLSGAFRVFLNDERHDLGEGDCLFFPSTWPHSWTNPGDEPATLMWVTTPPTY